MTPPGMPFCVVPLCVALMLRVVVPRVMRAVGVPVRRPGAMVTSRGVLAVIIVVIVVDIAVDGTCQPPPMRMIVFIIPRYPRPVVPMTHRMLAHDAMPVLGAGRNRSSHGHDKQEHGCQ
ncbi:MAG TPA: hypothetical protein VG900_17180 [Hyphomicrobiaceae bacterium]|nr:hypothetical protein [Hyphomicrobiaceae bacterium]